MAKCDRVWRVRVLWDTCDIRKYKDRPLDSRVLQKLCKVRQICKFRPRFLQPWHFHEYVKYRHEKIRNSSLQSSSSKEERANESMVMYERETDHEARNKK